MKDLSNSYQDSLDRVLRHIENNLDEPLPLEALSRIACFSSYHFHRIFTAMTGETVAAYIRRLLLQRAAARLSYSRAPVTTLALDAGYDSVDAFTRAFRALFGMSPSAYRKNGGSLALAALRSKGGPLFYPQTKDGFSMDIHIKSFPPRLAAATRHVGPYMDCGSAWNRLCGALAPLGLMGQGALACSICHDDPDITPPEKCRMEACLTLPDGMTKQTPAVQTLLQNKDIYLLTLGGEGEYASVLVKGPYTLLHPAYRSLYGEWLPKSGREPAPAPGLEIYHTCPDTTPPEELLTEILILLQPKK